MHTFQSQLGSIEPPPGRASYTAAAPQPASNSAANEESGEEALVFEKKKSRDDTEMDMTPMVDVTFLLLIFFNDYSVF